MMRNNSLPMVSVIIPTYKRPTMLARAVDSVLNQTYPNVDVIVVDDNNPETEGRRLTENVMQYYDDNDRVKYIKHPINKNGSAARNTGARATDAKYVAFLDDDDEFLPNKIANQVKILESRSEDWGACYSKYRYVNIKGGVRDSTENREGNLYVEMLTRDFSLGSGSNLFVRKTVYDSINGFDESFQRSQDIEFLVRLLKHYKMAYCNELGVIAYVEPKYNLDFNFILSQYIDTFSNQLSELSILQQKKFYDNMSGQLLLHALRSRHGLLSHPQVLNGHYSFFKAWTYVICQIFNYIRRKNRK